MDRINDSQRKVADFRDARDWSQFHNPKDLAIAISIEATELLEFFRVGYAGGDFIENAFKIIFKKPTLFKLPQLAKAKG